MRCHGARGTIRALPCHKGRQTPRMKPTVTPVVLLLLLLACFALGVISALVGNPQPQATPLPSADVSAATTVSGQTTILILGADDLQSADPTLLAIWYATFRLPGREVFVLGVPTDIQVPGDPPIPVAALFHCSPDSGADPTFLVALNQAVPLPPNLVLCLDRVAFSTLVDYLGGLDINGTRLDGAQTMAVLDLLLDDPPSLLATQSRVLEAMARQAPLIGATPDLTPLIALIPDHAYLSMPVNEVAALAAPLLPISPATIHIDLSTAVDPSEATPPAP